MTLNVIRQFFLLTTKPLLILTLLHILYPLLTHMPDYLLHLLILNFSILLLFSLLFLILYIFHEFVFLQGDEVGLEFDFEKQVHHLLLVFYFVLLSNLEAMVALLQGGSLLRGVAKLRQTLVSFRFRKRTHFVYYGIPFAGAEGEPFLFCEVFLVILKVVDRLNIWIWELIFD